MPGPSLDGETVSYNITLQYPNSSGFYQSAIIESGTFVVGSIVEASKAFSYNYVDQYGYTQNVNGTVTVDFTGSGYSLSYSGLAQPGSITFSFTGLNDESIGAVTGASQTSETSMQYVNDVYNPTFTAGTVQTVFALFGYQPGTTMASTVALTFSAPTGNTAPTFTSATTVSVQENTTAAMTVTATDAESNPITYSIVGGVDMAKFSINATSGALVFVSAPDFESASDTDGNNFYNVTVRASDGSLSTDQAITVAVTDANEAPVITSGAQAGSVNEDGTLVATGQVTSSDVDNGATAAYSGNATGTYGSFTVNAASGVWSYTLDNANHQNLAVSESHDETFTVTVTDDRGASATQDVVITVTGTNDAPVANDDTVALDEDTTADFNVLANDTDVDGDTLTVMAVTQGAHGTVSINPDYTLHYVPEADYSGPDSFTYTISDGAIEKTATVSVTVRAVNDPPYAFDDTATVEEDGSVAIFVTTNDTDADNQPLNIVQISTPGHGSVQLNGDNSITYTPNANFSGLDTFTYTVNDDQGRGAFGESTATVSVTVTGVNDAPENIVPAAQSTDEDTLLVFSGANGNAIAVSDVDVGAGTMTVTLAASHGVLTLSGTSGLTFNSGDGTADATMVFDGTAADINAALEGLTFAPDADYNGMADVTITTNDHGNTGTGGALQDADTMAIIVTPVSDRPEGTDNTVTLTEDSSYTFASADFGFSDIDGDTFVELRISSLPTNGLLTFDGSAVTVNQTPTVTQIDAGLLVFTPDPDANGTGYASFTFQVRDDGEAPNRLDDTSNTLTLDVTPVNDAPVLAHLIPDQFSAEDAAFSYVIPANAFSDIDGDALSYTATRANGNPLPAWLSFDATTRTFSGTPPLDYNGSFNVRVIASDGTLSASDVFTLTITPVEDPAVARDDVFITNESAVVIGNVYANNGKGPDTDPDGPIDAVIEVAGLAGNVGTTFALSSGATVKLQANGDLLYTPAASFTQLAAAGSGASNTQINDSFTYTLSGGSQAIVTVIVNGLDTADTLLGTAGNDSLHAGAYDDVLIGYTGADVLDGGTGNDTASYAPDIGGVFVNLTLGQGYGNAAQGDTYISIENVIGTGYNDVIIGDNGVNRLDGGGGNDRLIGSLGGDILIGGAGSDWASYEDNQGSVFVNLMSGIGYNNAAEGDTYSGIENAIGGMFDDFLLGDDNANRLDGAMGADTLYGFGGADTFMFSYAPGAMGTFDHPNIHANVDTLMDFVSGEDKLEISASAFGGGLTPGALPAGAFAVGTAATDADDRFIYDQANGKLYFDADGSGSGAQVLMALLPNHAPIAASDFVVV